MLKLGELDIMFQLSFSQILSVRGLGSPTFSKSKKFIVLFLFVSRFCLQSYVVDKIIKKKKLKPAIRIYLRGISWGFRKVFEKITKLPHFRILKILIENQNFVIPTPLLTFC